MDWKKVDERLIRLGELILDLESLGNHEKELEEMNKGRPGPRFRIANNYIQFLAAVRYLFQMPYRQLEGYTRALNRLVPELPQADQLGHQETHPPPTCRPLREPQRVQRPRHHSAGLHRSQGGEGRRLGGAQAREEEEVREAPLRRPG
jgi:hypothetical protein